MTQYLQVSSNRRFLTREDGTPFFWLGDTAWELFHRLNYEEAELYLSKRAEQGYTVIQTVALAEFEGVTKENAYGRLPLKRNEEGAYDPALPDTEGEDSYWAHVDRIVDLADQLGLYIGFLPTWGDKYNQMFGQGPEIFTEENARRYGRWLGSRYKERPNIVWVLGGDRPLLTRKHFAIVHAMAEGLADGDGGRHLRTFHPPGEKSSSCFLHEETWLDFNMIQSGHGKRLLDNDQRVAADYALKPVKPTFDAEPCYEDHPIGFKAENGYFDAADVRQAAYNNVFSGGLGHTYGHHSIWSMTTEPTDYFIMTWRDALDRPGACQMRHLRALIESKPFLEHVPASELIPGNYSGANRMTAVRGTKHAMIYFPNGLPAEIALDALDWVGAEAAWYDPRTGVYGERCWVNTKGGVIFLPPTSGRGEDWVLVLDRGALT